MDTIGKRPVSVTAVRRLDPVFASGGNVNRERNEGVTNYTQQYSGVYTCCNDTVAYRYNSSTPVDEGVTNETYIQLYSSTKRYIS